jgi:hypothetical protein
MRDTWTLLLILQKKGCCKLRKKSLADQNGCPLNDHVSIAAHGLALRGHPMPFDEGWGEPASWSDVLQRMGATTLGRG